MAVGSIVAFGAASPPAGFLLCDGSTFSSDTYPNLATVLGDTFGTHSGTTYYLPDLRQRVPIGKAASGTGSTFAGTGGAIDHVHSGPAHGHAVTQPDAHTAHTVTQAGAHTNLTHSGAAASAHSALAHSGATVSNHTISSEAGTHSDHAAASGTGGTHTHDAHPNTANRTTGGANVGITATTAHSDDAAFSGHTHDAHGAHSGSTIDAHADVSGSHAGDSHTVSAQPNDHTAISHSTTVTLAHSHTGLTIDTTAGTGNTGSNNEPFQAVPYMIQAA